LEALEVVPVGAAVLVDRHGCGRYQRRRRPLP
jgi:hypothetical protein